MLLVSDHTQNMIPRGQISASSQAEGTPIALQSLRPFPTCSRRRTLTGHVDRCRFKVQHHIYELPVLRQKRRDRDFDAESTAGSYRFDPDGWFSRHLLSTAPSTKEFSSFRSERADKLIVEARQTINKQKRLELYRN